VPTTTITQDQRNGLYELVRNHLAGIEDIWTTLEQNKDFATAERLGIEFGEDIRLLQDLGWTPTDSRQAVDLTMPTHNLIELLQRLHGDAKQLLVESPSERKSREEDEQVNERFQLGLDACEKVLADLDPRERGSA
jgi:hypothetical protein